MIEDFHSRIITEDIFNELLKKEPYYEGRWEYYNEIIEKLHSFQNINSVLEIGPYKLPFVVGSDIIDVRDKYSVDFPIEIGKFIKHNCAKTPFPIDDKAYDLVIACQVLEHIGIYGEQVEAFHELERISKKALISLPYLWHRPKSRDHHMIDKDMIDFWASGRKPSFELISGSTSKRILLLYEFDK